MRIILINKRRMNLQITEINELKAELNELNRLKIQEAVIYFLNS
jgi:hypothetical protein